MAMVLMPPFVVVAAVLAILLCSALVSAFGVCQGGARFSSVSRYGSSRHGCRRVERRVSGSELRMSPLVDVANEYYSMLSDYPLATQSLTGGIFAGVGDVVAQYGEMAKENDTRDWALKLDLPRSKRFMLKGLGGGLIWFSWFDIADQMSAVLCQDFLSSMDVSESVQGNVERIVRTVSSVLLEQFIACPIIYALWDIPFPALLDGAPVDSIPSRVRSKVPGLLVENAKVWTFINLIVYNIPLQWRILATSCTDIFWQSIISSVTSAKIQSEEVGDELAGEERTREAAESGFGYRPSRRTRQFSGAAAVAAKKESR